MSETYKHTSENEAPSSYFVENSAIIRQPFDLDIESAIAEPSIPEEERGNLDAKIIATIQFKNETLHLIREIEDTNESNFILTAEDDPNRFVVLAAGESLDLEDDGRLIITVSEQGDKVFVHSDTVSPRNEDTITAHVLEQYTNPGVDAAFDDPFADKDAAIQISRR